MPMRLSQFHLRTTKETPADAELVSHQLMLRAGMVHFLAHHGLHLAQHAQAQRRPGVQAGGQAPQHARLEHQLVAGDLGVGRGFLDGAEVELRQAHRWLAGVGRKRTAILPCTPPAGRKHAGPQNPKLAA